MNMHCDNEDENYSLTQILDYLLILEMSSRYRIEWSIGIDESGLNKSLVKKFTYITRDNREQQLPRVISLILPPPIFHGTTEILII